MSKYLISTVFFNSIIAYLYNMYTFTTNQQIRILTEKIESIEWCNAVIYLLSEYYSQTHQLGKVTIRPEEEEDAGDVEEEATTSLRKKLEATFEITLNPEHKLLVATVLDTMFTFCQDRKKITKELEAMRCIKKKDRRSGDTHNKWVFQGMREKPKPTDAT